VGDDGKMKVVQTGMRPSPSKLTEAGRERDVFIEMEDILTKLGGEDKIVSGAEWSEARSLWAMQGYNVNSFDAAFKRFTNYKWDIYEGINVKKGVLP